MNTLFSLTWLAIGGAFAFLILAKGPFQWRFGCLRFSASLFARERSFDRDAGDLVRDFSGGPFCLS